MTLTDHNGDRRLDGADGFTEIRCPLCGSLAFMYPRVLDDDKPVKCAGCGAFLSTYGEMKRRSEEG
jgi:DNA-directed RNA polymerase subunit RPC12/RpoP